MKILPLIVAALVQVAAARLFYHTKSDRSGSIVEIVIPKTDQTMPRP